MIEHVIYLGAAIGCAAAPFSRLRSRAPWACLVFFTLAGLFLIMAVCGLALDLHYWDLSGQGLLIFRSYIQLIRGFIIGCLFVLLVSGNFLGKKIIRNETAN